MPTPKDNQKLTELVKLNPVAVEEQRKQLAGLVQKILEVEGDRLEGEVTQGLLLAQIRVTRLHATEDADFEVWYRKAGFETPYRTAERLLIVAGAGYRKEFIRKAGWVVLETYTRWLEREHNATPGSQPVPVKELVPRDVETRQFNVNGQRKNLVQMNKGEARALFGEKKPGQVKVEPTVEQRQQAGRLEGFFKLLGMEVSLQLSVKKGQVLATAQLPVGQLTPLESLLQAWINTPARLRELDAVTLRDQPRELREEAWKVADLLNKVIEGLPNVHPNLVPGGGKGGKGDRGGKNVVKDAASGGGGKKPGKKAPAKAPAGKGGGRKTPR